MASFRCYDNSDVIAFLIMTNFHLSLIKLWWQFFQMFVYGDVVMLRIGRYWPWKHVTVSSHASYGPRFFSAVRDCMFRKHSGNLREFFGQMVYRPPLAKNFPYAYVFTHRFSSSFWIFGWLAWDKAQCQLTRTGKRIWGNKNYRFITNVFNTSAIVS